MSEALFPILGAVLALVLALPASALAAKLALAILARFDDGLHGSGSLRYAILVGSTAIPIAWLVSAGFHQAESLRSSTTCALPHESEAWCLEALGFVLALSLIVGARALLATRSSGSRAAIDRSPRGLRAQRRIDALIAARSDLADLCRRVDVVSGGAAASCGWIAPRVELRTDLAETLDDESLVATLAHELEHVRGRDPLRYGLASLALAINPLGRPLLGRELARWTLVREARCDRLAVANGACALSLAQSILRIARPTETPLDDAPALGAGDPRSIRMRVSLLMAYADARPSRGRDPSSLRALIFPVVLALVLPHFASTAPLDVVHTLSEGVGLFVLGGRS